MLRLMRRTDNRGSNYTLVGTESLQFHLDHAD
jgi:hypothetical protein